MPVSEQLNIRLEPGEKARVSEAARRSDTTVSAYVRQRLFGRQPDDSDKAVLQLLAEIKPMVKRAMRTIDGNLATIQKLRDDAPQRDDDAVADRARLELNPVELASIADRLRLVPAAPARRRRTGPR